MKTRTLDRLAKLSELRSSGALTADEFEAKKREILTHKSSRWPFLVIAVAAGITIIIAIWAWMPNNKPQNATTAQVTPAARLPIPTPSQPALQTPADRLVAAFEAATGHRRAFVQTVKGEEFTVTPTKIIDLPFGPALLVKREIKDGCHACSGFIGVYYLHEDHGQTIITASFPEAVPGWGWGASPIEWQLTNRFTSNPAIYASGGYTGQGITESSATLTEFRPDGPITSDVIGTGFSDAGAISDDNQRPGCEVDGKIAHVVKDQSFEVIVSGTVTGRDLYVKRRGKFVAVKKRDWGLPCSA